MSPMRFWPLRGGAVLLTAQLVLACGGDGKQPSLPTDVTPPTTRVTPEGGAFTDPVEVTLTCDDGGGSGCAVTYYTLDGSEPTSGSPRYVAPIAVTRSATLRFTSTDVAGNVEPVKQAAYVLPDPDREASEQIQTVRTAPDGSLFLPIEGAFITYIKDGAGSHPLLNDPSGLFLQAERGGPAVFVPVDPMTLTPVPEVGDRVRVTVTMKHVINGQTRANIANFTVLSRGNPVSALLQDVSEVDVTTGGVPPDHESRYVSISGTIGAPGFSASGSQHVQAPLTTVGVPAGSASESSLRLRLVQSVHDRLGLSPGCEVTVTSPLWVFKAEAQPRPTLHASGWRVSDVTVHACPVPRVLKASASARGTVKVRISRPIDAASLVEDGSQFSIPGLSVTRARLESPTVVSLTTSPQTVRQPYTLSVANTLQDRLGVGVDPAAAQAAFPGFVQPAWMLLSEVAPNVPHDRDLVELYVEVPGSTQGFTLMDGNTTLATLPDVEVAAGDIIVIHLNPDRVTPGRDAPASETQGKTQYAASSYTSNYDNAWDFQGEAVGLGNGNRVLRLRDAFDVTRNGVAVVQEGDTSADYLAQLQALQAERVWLPEDCSGAPCTYGTFPSAWSVSVDWGEAFSRDHAGTLQRHRLFDSSGAEDWTLSVPSIGYVNAER